MTFKQIIIDELDIKSIYHLLISGISPRPIALVGSIDKNGISNLAPFSFFNAFGANPPILGFSPALSGKTGLPKDTLLNIKETKEFTVSIVNSNIVEQISLSSCEFEKNIDEFDKTGLTKLKSKFINSFGVSESNFIMECKLHNIIELGNKPASGNLILGEVIMFHINESIIDNNIIDPFKLDAIARNGGSWYTKSNKGLFEVKKPKNIGIGFDSIPDVVLKSDLTGNQLAKLASVDKKPTYLQNKKYEKLNKNQFISAIKFNIEQDKIVDAWQIILHMQEIYEK